MQAKAVLSYKSVAGKLLILYVLNVLDMVFTLYLCRTRGFQEVNPLLSPFIGSGNNFFLIKAVLVGILCLYIIIRMKKATFKQLKVSNMAVSILTGIYALVVLFHLFWIFTA